MKRNKQLRYLLILAALCAALTAGLSVSAEETAMQSAECALIQNGGIAVAAPQDRDLSAATQALADGLLAAKSEINLSMYSLTPEELNACYAEAIN